MVSVRAAVLGLSLALLALSVEAKNYKIQRTRHIIAAYGMATTTTGENVKVCVFESVEDGEDDLVHAEAALSRQGARFVVGSAFQVIANVKWPGSKVTQYYNAASEPTASLSSLLNTHTTWGAVDGSNFQFVYGGTTARCPSLHSGAGTCGGRFDGFNDVGWRNLNSGSTLGVTWTGISGGKLEADLVMNTGFQWSTSLNGFDAGFDIESVFLHENGHVLGLDHSSVLGAIMYPSISGADIKRTLDTDDINGLISIYPGTKSTQASTTSTQASTTSTKASTTTRTTTTTPSTTTTHTTTTTPTTTTTTTPQTTTTTPAPATTTTQAASSSADAESTTTTAASATDASTSATEASTSATEASTSTTVGCGAKCLHVDSVTYRKVKTSLYIDIVVSPVQSFVEVLVRLNGQDFGVGSGWTNTKTKLITFVIPRAPNGTYSTVMRSVTRAGYLWDNVQSSSIQCFGGKKICKK